MSVHITINTETREFDSLLIALRTLADAHGYRWGLPHPIAIDKGYAPRDMSMPALYNRDHDLITTHPWQALRHLIELECATRLEGIEIALGTDRNNDSDTGVLGARGIVWDTPLSTRFMTPTDELMCLEANTQLADFAAARTRLIRDRYIDSLVDNQFMTAYRIAKTLKMTPSAIPQIRTRLRKIDADPHPESLA